MEQRKMRVTQDHWRLILEYAEYHPEIITNKFSTHIQGKQTFKNLWEELANKLNSLGQGYRSVEEWKKTLADWKSKTKKKASQNSKDILQTGGGPANSTPLSVLEEKLISIMGKTAIFGDGTASERGIKRSNPEVAETQVEATEVVELDGEVTFDEFVDVRDVDLCEDHDYIKIFEAGCLAGSSTSGVNVETQNVCSGNSAEHKKPKKSCSNSTKENSRKKDLNEMHNEVLHVLTSIESRLEGMDTSLKSIANSLAIIAKHFSK